MPDRSQKPNLKIDLSRQTILRELLSLVQFVIFASALAWLWTSDAGKQPTIWFAVGLPLLFAYIFVGGYLRRRLGLKESNPA